MTRNLIGTLTTRGRGMSVYRLRNKDHDIIQRIKIEAPEFNGIHDPKNLVTG